MESSKKRSFHLIRQAIDGSDDPTEQEVEVLVPQELLRMAKEWRREPEKGFAGFGQPINGTGSACFS